MPQLTCSLDGCNNTFHRKPSKVKKNKSGNFYCCKDHKHKHLPQALNPFYINNQDYSCLNECNNCGKLFARPVGKITKKQFFEQRFCSYKCKNKFHKWSEEKVYKAIRERQQKKCDELHDSYIHSLILNQTSLKHVNEIPIQLIQLKRKQIKLYRLNNEKSKRFT